MSAREAYQQKLEAKLNETKADIDKLKAKADSAQADAKLEMYEDIERLRKREERVQAKLIELGEAGESAWEDVKAGAESAWEDLRSSFEKARDRFS